MDWSGCKSAPLHADIRSHLAGSSAIQPLAAGQESLHPLSEELRESSSARKSGVRLYKNIQYLKEQCIFK